MLRSLEDALDTLKEAGARYYTITGRGIQLSHESEGQTDDPNFTEDAAQAQFSKHWGRLAGGQVYNVAYRKKAAARTKQDCFTVLKPTDQNPEAAAAVAGFGVGTGYGNEVQAKLDRLETLERAEATRAAVEPIQRQLDDLKRATEGGFDLDKVAGVFAHLNGLAGNLAKLNTPGARPAPMVANRGGGRVAAPAPLADDDTQARGAAALTRMHAALGSDEAFADALVKLAGFVEKDPAGAVQMLNYV